MNELNWPCAGVIPTSRSSTRGTATPGARGAILRNSPQFAGLAYPAHRSASPTATAATGTAAPRRGAHSRRIDSRPDKLPGALSLPPAATAAVAAAVTASAAAAAAPAAAAAAVAVAAAAAARAAVAAVARTRTLDFIYNTYGVLGFLVGAKLLSYLYAVFPSLTGRQ